MIFDDRDVEKVEDKETMRKNHKVTNSQLSFGDIEENKEKEVKEKKVATKKEVKKEVNETSDEVKENEDLLAESENLESESNEVEVNSYESSFDKDEDGNFLKSLDHVLHDSMIPYSEYVILDRALPRVEDGLKPVQRRILYAMYEEGFTPDKPYKKCANTVGYVLGKYHPHGDTSVYNALVRLAQDFNMREVLVDGHGNFGSVDGDDAAAMRYTEAKLAPLSLELLRDIEKNTVRWTNNYDDSKLEPEMLPGRFPNLLVNGASGIAVGLATNIPTHNLSETIDGAIAVIDNPDIKISELMKIIKGPDFPTGGIIMGGGELKTAYETGKGKIIIRGKVHIEQEKNEKQSIVITEFPYQVNKASFLQKVVELREKHKEILSGITDIRDESDRSGIRAVITCKKDVDPNMILNFLYKYTELQTTFGINMVAIANGKPLLMGLKEILTYYVNYQRDVVLRRTKFDLKSCEDRAHILKGLLIAIQDIDAVIKIIKKSSGTIEAKQKLMEKFALTEVQAQAILDMRLARLTSLEVGKIKEELASLEEQIKKLSAIAGSKKLQMETVKEEMLEIKKKYGTKRLTQIDKDEEKFEIDESMIAKPVKDMIITYSARNAIKKIPEKSFMISSKSVSKTSTLNEVHSIIFKTQSDKDLLLFTSKGNCYKLSQDDILEARWKDRGTLLTDAILGYQKDEKVLYICDYKDKLSNFDLIFTTNDGQVRKTNSSEFDIKKQSFNCFKLNEKQELVAIQKFEKDKTLLFITKDGMSLNADISDVPSQSKSASGVKGINLNDGDEVVYTSLVNEKDNVLVLTDLGYTKRVAISQIGVLGRNRKGVKLITFDKNGKKIILSKVVRSSFEVMAYDDKSKLLSIKSDDVALENRTTKGKGMIKATKTEKIKSAYIYMWN
ncbi:MAG: DNA topoisomerase 4 subunit A [Clostridiales bacterium]|nr:DNA topoisomerase 4 subunit A [Candidatus Apopatousia equi]